MKNFLRHTPLDGRDPKLDLKVQLDRSLEALDELNTPFVDREKIMVMNLASSDVSRDGSSTTLGEMQASEQALSVASLLSTKAIIASNGCCVVSKQHKPLIESYLQYTESMGLTHGAAENLVYVDDPNNMFQVLRTIADAAERQALFYFDTPRGVELANDTGAIQAGSGPPSCEGSVEIYANKTKFRDIMEHLATDGQPVFPYPRIPIVRANLLDMASTSQQVKQALEYYIDKTNSGRDPVLFLQVADAGGGMGNTVVYRDEKQDLHVTGFKGKEYHFPAGEDQIRSFVNTLRKSDADYEITPYLDLIGSYAITIMVTDVGVTLLGPRRQLLDPTSKQFRGSSLDIDISPPEYPDLARIVKLTEKFAEQLHKDGFRGHTDVDVHEYIDRDGVPKASFSESNMRRDAGSMLIGLMLKHEELRQQLRRRSLSLLLHDHITIHPHLVAELNGDNAGGFKPGGMQGLLGLLRQNQIPLASQYSPYGAVLMTPPFSVKGKVELSLGITARSDEEKYQLLYKIQDLLEEKRKK